MSEKINTKKKGEDDGYRFFANEVDYRGGEINEETRNRSLALITKLAISLEK